MIFSKLLLNNLNKTMADGIRHGHLTIQFPDGTRQSFGDAKASPSGVMVIKDWRVIAAVAAKGDIGFGECYMDGLWDTPDLEPLLQVFIANVDTIGKYGYGFALQKVMLAMLDKFLRRNTISGAKKNIMAHYDLGNDFYSLWLDKSMTYSSAIYQGNDPLELAQAQKYGRILGKLPTLPQSILEIGCGWGGFAESALAQGHSVKGLTLSPSQKAYCDTRLDQKATIALQDYRHETGKFDSIVSIEMFEAVGESYWPGYFKTVKQALAKNGKAIIQTITIKDEVFDAYRSTSDYIRAHIFPGGLLPSNERFIAGAEKAGLTVTENFAFGHDYARTLREWRVRFEAALPQIKAMGFSDNFIRGWRLYLMICAAGFTVNRINVSQFELVHD
jgi:cyclopropane-fatty-acyl-phospholipid synthase